MTQPIRIGTRGSPLALAQAHMVADALRAANVGVFILTGRTNRSVEEILSFLAACLGEMRKLAENGGKVPAELLD